VTDDSNVVEMLPTFPCVRCDSCRTVYRVNDEARPVVIGDCPRCGSQRFSTVLRTDQVIGVGE